MITTFLLRTRLLFVTTAGLIVLSSASPSLIVDGETTEPPTTTTVPCGGNQHLTWHESWGPDICATGSSTSAVVRKLLATVRSWFECESCPVNTQTGCTLDSVTIEDRQGNQKSTTGPPYDPDTFDWDISGSGVITGSLNLDNLDRITMFCSPCDD